MPKFMFEIQNCIEVCVDAEDKEAARMHIVDNTQDYADQMVDGSAYISDGEEVDDGGDK